MKKIMGIIVVIGVIIGFGISMSVASDKIAVKTMDRETACQNLKKFYTYALAQHCAGAEVTQAIVDFKATIDTWQISSAEKADFKRLAEKAFIDADLQVCEYVDWSVAPDIEYDQCIKNQ